MGLPPLLFGTNAKCPRTLTQASAGILISLTQGLFEDTLENLFHLVEETSA